MRRRSQGTGPGAQKKTLHAAEQQRPDVAQARAAWREQQPALNPAQLVFLDETWTTTSMTRRYGRAPRGQRLIASVPHGHWKTNTFLAALRQDKITAPCVIDGAINGATFLAYVEQFLAPTLRPGDIVIMDNLGSHKVAGVSQAIEAVGARLLYRPPYSRISTPLNSSSPSSRRGAPLRHCTRQSPQLSLSAPEANVQTTSPTPDTIHLIGKCSRVSAAVRASFHHS